jgi:uncharacterized protein (TIGR03437 family)
MKWFSSPSGLLPVFPNAARRLSAGNGETALMEQTRNTNLNFTRPVALLFSALICICATAQTAVNSASGGPAVAPGSLISIYGAFPIAAGQATTLPLPTSTYYGYYLTSATGGNPLTATRLPLLYWGPSQINSVLTVPTNELALWGPGGGGSLVAIEGILVDLQTQAPGIFTNPSADCAVTTTGCGERLTRAIITNSGYALILSTNPAHAGQGLVIWCTGLGTAATVPLVTVLPPSGSPINAAVFYSGHSTLAGLDQVNFYVPSGSELMNPCVVGSRIEIPLSMKSTTTGVQSNVLSLPVLVDSCK